MKHKEFADKCVNYIIKDVSGGSKSRQDYLRKTP